MRCCGSYVDRHYYMKICYGASVREERVLGSAAAAAAVAAAQQPQWLCVEHERLQHAGTQLGIHASPKPVRRSSAHATPKATWWVCSPSCASHLRAPAYSPVA